MIEPAILPPQFIAKPKVPLEALKPGESGWVVFTDMAIDNGHRAYIDPQASIQGKGRNRILVTRTDAGFEVFIQDTDLDWEPGWYNPRQWDKYERYVPVVKITHEPQEIP